MNVAVGTARQGSKRLPGIQGLAALVAAAAVLAAVAATGFAVGAADKDGGAGGYAERLQGYREIAQRVPEPDLLFYFVASEAERDSLQASLDESAPYESALSYVRPRILVAGSPEDEIAAWQAIEANIEPAWLGLPAKNIKLVDMREKGR